MFELTASVRFALFCVKENLHTTEKLRDVNYQPAKFTLGLISVFALEVLQLQCSGKRPADKICRRGNFRLTTL